jgi:ferredoxin-type protein NapH
MTRDELAGRQAWNQLGFWHAHRYLILRRCAQLFFLFLFLSGPLFGFWIAEGTLASSETFDVLPLTDPFIFLQSIVAGHLPEVTAILGAGIVLAAYLVFGGRTYCSWVCPINPVTDFSDYLRRRFGFEKGVRLSRATRWYLMAGVVLVSFATGSMAWELINPVTTLHRSLVFGFGAGSLSVLAIFLFDLFVAKHGWCGHLCPVGAFYGLVGKVTLLRVSARARAACDDCMDCYAVCPENHVISPALKGDRTGVGPIILSGDCTSCGRCIDVCPQEVFNFSTRFDNRLEPDDEGTSEKEEHLAAA